MAVYSMDNLGFGLLYEAFLNKPVVGEASFFDNLKMDFRDNTATKVSITLPGIIAFLYYSGSIYFLTFTIFLIFIIFLLLNF